MKSINHLTMVFSHKEPETNIEKAKPKTQNVTLRHGLLYICVTKLILSLPYTETYYKFTYLLKRRNCTDASVTQPVRTFITYGK